MQRKGKMISTSLRAGACGVLWSLAAIFLIYDTPMSHPRIGAEEKQYLLSSKMESENKVDCNNNNTWNHLALLKINTEKEESGHSVEEHSTIRPRLVGHHHQFLLLRRCWRVHRLSTSFPQRSPRSKRHRSTAARVAHSCHHPHALIVC